MQTVGWLIAPMRHFGANPSGTVLSSALLLASSKALVTLAGFGTGRGVRKVLPVRYTRRGNVAGIAR